MPIVVPPHSKTVALQLAIADYLQNQTGINWREFDDTIQIPSTGVLAHSGIVSFVRKGGDLQETLFRYRVQTRLRCAANDKRIVDESLGDYIDFLDDLIQRCIRLSGTYRSVVLNCSVRLVPESDWLISIRENQDSGATGTITRQWELEIDNDA